MMMFCVEIVQADGTVLLSSRYYTNRKLAEAKRREMQEDPILQSHPTAHVVIRSEIDPGKGSSS
jgi:hypothetical protein